VLAQCALCCSELECHESEHRVRLSIQVKPNSQKTELILEPDGTLIMRVAAPPTRGKANKEMVKWLAKKIGKPSSQVRLISGLHSRTKIIEILNISQGEVMKNLTTKA